AARTTGRWTPGGPWRRSTGRWATGGWTHAEAGARGVGIDADDHGDEIAVGQFLDIGKGGAGRLAGDAVVGIERVAVMAAGLVGFDALVDELAQRIGKENLAGEHGLFIKEDLEVH